MQTTVGQLLNSESALAQLSKTGHLPGHTSFRIARIIKNAGKAIADFHQAKLDLIKQYGSEVEDWDGNGNKGWKVDEDKLETFQPLFSKLLDETVDFAVTPLKAEDFGNADIAPEIFIAIDWMLEQDLSPAPPETTPEK